jgi:hypothetical protein
MKTNCARIPLDYELTYTAGARKTKTTKLSAAVQNAVRKAYGRPDVEGDQAPLAVYFTTDRAGYRLPRFLPKQVPKGQAAAYLGALCNKTVNFRDFMARFWVEHRLYPKPLFHTGDMPFYDTKGGEPAGESAVENPDHIGQPATVAVAGAVSTFLQGFSNLRVEGDPFRAMGDRPSLLVDKDGSSLNPYQLSDGERAFLAVVCDLGRRLALANPALANPLEGAGVVLMDELELHLHPSWQREVVEKLRTTFPNIQFIATTHSPFIVQSLRPGELIYLDHEVFAEYSDKSIEDISENVMDVEVPQKSERYKEMLEAAEQYFRLLRQSPHDAPAVQRAERLYNELAVRYSDDPAFQALLKLERETQLGGDNEAR